MDERIERAVLHIAKEFRQNLFLEDLAGIACLSKFHFQKLFKKETGLSPLQYLNKTRLEHAAHFLEIYPGAKQTDVAFECGYSSPAVFTRSFTQYYKIPPSVYQKNQPPEKKRESNFEQYKLPITYISRKELIVIPSSLAEESLARSYGTIIDRAGQPVTSYGIYLDVPTHKPVHECRYYAGIEKNTAVLVKQEYSFAIEEGYYTHFDIVGDFVVTSLALIEYKQKYIDSSSYIISSLIGFEKLRLPSNAAEFDYFNTLRTIYIKIRHK